MSVSKPSLLRLAALTLVAGAAIALPTGAKASLTNGLSVRVGAFFPQSDGLRSVTDAVVFGGGIEYKVNWIPHVFTGEGWSTSISADIHYTERKAGIFRFIPVSINQVYNFERSAGMQSYAGFCITAATFGGTANGFVDRPIQRSSESGGRQPTITRFGGGLILGSNLTNKIYIEGRYEWFDRHHSLVDPQGFRAYAGYRF